MAAAQAGRGGKAAGRLALLLFVIVAVAIGVAVYRGANAPLPPDEPRPADLVGTPLRVPTAEGDVLVLLTEQSRRRWERRSRPSGRLMIDGAVHYSVYRWELWAFDADSLQLRWRRVLREARPTLPQESPARLLGSDGVHVWWQAGEGGTVPEGVRAQAPAPVGPQGVSLSDGLPAAVPPPAALAHVPAGDEHTPWRYQAGSLLREGQWLGLLDDEEAAALRERPEREARWPDRAPSAPALYRLWQARVGRALPPSDFGEARVRFEAIGAPGPADGWRQAGWLRRPESGEVVMADSPSSAFVLHRGPGAWQVDRIAAADGRRLWRVDLPQARFVAMSPGARALVFTGTRDGGLVPGTQYEQVGGLVLSAIDVQSGERRDLDLAEASLAEEKKE